MIGTPSISTMTSAAVVTAVATSIVPAVTTPFSPPSVSGLFIWYDAADTATIHATGAVVSQWDDKSGGGRHLTVPVGRRGPDTGTRTRNGLNVLDFDGVNEVLAKSTVGITLSYTIFAVCVEDTTPAAPFIATIVRMLIASEHGLRITSTAAEMHAGSGVVSGSAYANGSWRQITGTHAGGAGTTITLRHNAVAVGSATPSTSSAADELMVGAIAGNGLRGLDGAIAEILIYGPILGSTDRDAVEAYLSTKWAV